MGATKVHKETQRLYFFFVLLCVPLWLKKMEVDNARKFSLQR